MLGLRISACLALMLAGCGSGESPAVAVSTSALNSCNNASECPQPPPTAVCVKAVCSVGHVCRYATDKTGACAAGCTLDGQCSLGASYCYAPTCDVPSGDCVFTIPPGNTCACTPADVTGCAGHSTCQNVTPTCPFGVCTYTAVMTTGGCCNGASDCNTGASCNDTNNQCGCAGGKKYCDTGPNGCVTGTECCQDSDCGAGNTCSDGTCACGGTEQHCAGIGCIAASGCCATVDCTSPAMCNGSHVCVCAGGQRYCQGGVGCIASTGCCDATECSGVATCDGTTHVCTCGVNQRYCAGTGCVPSTGCCMASDCTARANATVACTSNACVYTCNSGFHDCSGVCKADDSVATCGSMCSACPAGNSCQTPACTAGACGFVAAGASPCCNTPSDCTPSNACQMATACTDNRCVFGSTGASGCCNSVTDCPTPADPCLTAACVANQCAEAPVLDCANDGGEPLGPDMTVGSEPDLSAPLTLSGGGGCALAATRDVPSAALAFVALLLVAFARRRRSA